MDLPNQKSNINFKEFIEKYQVLLNENDSLKEEIKILKSQLHLEKLQAYLNEASQHEIELSEDNPEQPEILDFPFTITKNSGSAEKIKLYMSLFRGRDDVYAKRWENNKKGTVGYSPACGNEWKPKICQKPKNSCAKCKNQDYLPLNESVVDDHLRGRNNFVAGIYPLLTNETCYFVAIDFDGEGWEKDITTLRKICSELDIPSAIERSRSGNGAHVWFFFENPITAFLARKFGSAMLTYAMNQRHEIQFKSYDRLFPNQDTMPKGGFGNLIALPLGLSGTTSTPPTPNNSPCT